MRVIEYQIVQMGKQWMLIINRILAENPVGNWRVGRSTE